jgi:5-methylcytosine-specific restriction endonuclease McrA
MSTKTDFHLIVPTLENYYRGIILFGDNTATYKFALGKSLLELATNSNDLVTLEELAEPFSAHLVKHISHSPNQINRSNRGKFLDVCDSYNLGEATKDELLACTVDKGFNNVIDAFHIINGEEIDKPFYVDERRDNNGIRLTDELRQLVLEQNGAGLTPEIESRWNLVETAWELGVSKNTLEVHHETETGEFFIDLSNRRRSITSSRDALNGYQRGKCFFCFDSISVTPKSDQLAHVDHFFPHVLKTTELGNRVDEIWNLVLACKSCNSAKGAKVPDPVLVERLNRRNEYLIESNHPLSQTIIRQTGTSKKKRTDFIQSALSVAIIHRFNTWKPEIKGDPTF